MSEAAVIARGTTNSGTTNGTANGRPSPSGSVLIIDDEAEIRESLQTLLEMEGVRSRDRGERRRRPGANGGSSV